MRPRLLALLLVLAALAGCGGDEDESASKPAKTVTATVYEKPQPGIPADVGQWMVTIGVQPGDPPAFTVGKVIAPKGNTNFRLENPGSTEHQLKIEEVRAGGGSISTPPVSEGSAWIRVSLAPGRKYVFYCPIPGHREAGMEGVIEVDPALEGSDLKPFKG